MKPIILCEVDKLNLEELNGYSKVFLSPTDDLYADIGLGKKVSDPKSIIDQKIGDADFFCNISLINAINHAKELKSKVHIIGDFDADKNVLDALIKVSKNLAIKNVYLHLFSSKKINVKNITKEYSIAKVANTFDKKTLKNSKRVYEAIVKNKKMEDATELNSAHISSSDTVIFYNLDLSQYKVIIDSLVSKNFNTFPIKALKDLCVMTIFGYDKLPHMYDMNNYFTLGEYLSGNNLKQLRINVDNYSLDGYKYTNNKNIKISDGNILNTALNKYDLVIAKINGKDLSKLEDKVKDIDGTLILISNNTDKVVLASSLNLSNGSTLSICSTIIELLGLNEVSGLNRSLVKNTKELAGFIFRAVSILFVMICVGIYMGRFLHFYLTK